MFQVKLLDKSSKIEVEQCIELLSNSFNGKLDYFQWKHNLNEDFKIEEYTFCIFKNNLCIATTQVIINEIIISGKIYRFGILCDGATHKDYRRLGLFEKLLSHINQFCSKENVAFVYSTGNEKSRKALMKLGFTDFFGSYKASKKIRYNQPIMKLYNNVLNSFSPLKFKKFDTIKLISIEEYSKFTDVHNKNFSISFKKSEAYLKWRLAEPTGDYMIYGTLNSENNLNGVLVIKKSHDELYIVDVQYHNLDSLNQLLQFVTGLAIKDQAIAKINCIHNNFKGIGSIFVENKFTIKKEDSSALLYQLQSDFKVSKSELDEMHYLRIDKNE